MLVPNPADVRRYFETLFGGAESGYLPLWHLPTKQTTWIPVTNADAAVEACKDLGHSGNLYVGVGLHPAPLGIHSRGAASGVCGIPGFWLDFDVAGPGHRATNLPPASAAQRLILGAVPLPPSYVISSGGGLHCYWLLREFWHFADEDDRCHAVSLAGALQSLVIAAAQTRGWTVDHTSNLTQVLRPAGTINRKPRLPDRPVRVLQDVRRRYSIEDLEAVLPLDNPDFLHISDRPYVPRSGPARVPAALWSRIAAQCAFMAHCEADAASLSEPEWHAMMSILGCCHNGEAIAHRVSAPYPGYEASETDRKYAYAHSTNAPMRCETIRAYRSGEPWCSGCPHWGGIPSPIVLGYVPGYVYLRPDATPGRAPVREQAL
jgi:putative DNA primase/helicase